MTFKQNTKMKAEGSHYCKGGKVKKMAGGGGVQSYDEAKKANPDIRVPKEGEPSNYRGYGWDGDTKEQAAKTTKAYFDANTDSMKKAYNTYKQKGDPSADEMSKRLGEGDEEAAGIMQRAHRMENKGAQQGFELKQALKFKTGGKVKRGNKKK